MKRPPKPAAFLQPMCGIVGATGDQGSWVKEATRCLRHRGPDRQAWHRDAQVQLGHARLAVVDLTSAADQPMFSDDRSLALVFNGEFYDFRAHRRRLRRQGHRFRTRSDAEIIFKLSQVEGDRFLEKINGPFAIGIWDFRRRSLLLARDRLGEKPLYYTSLADGNLLFASEIKSLLRHPKVSAQLDEAALDEYLTYFYVPAPRTVFRGIRQLLPGQQMVWQDGNSMLSRYWRLPPVAHPNGDFADLREEIHHLLGESVRRTLLADVPVGVFLSGGLDSSSIVALASQHCSQLATFTVTFDGEGARYDEREPAAQVARHFGTRHQELCVSGNSADLLPTIVRHFDQPFGNPTALLSYLISQATRHEVKVVLGGDGGDELFGGYPRYRGIRWARTYGLLPAGLRGWASRLAQHLPESRAGAHNWRRTRQFLTATLQSPAAMYLEWVGYFGPALKAELYTEPLRRRVEGHRAERFLERLLAAEDGDFLSGAMRADLHSFLPGNILEYGDKMSMAHGLELRLPFLDPQLVERIASLPADLKMRAGQPKYLLRRMMSDRLPPFVLRRSKAGFNPPMGMWIEGELRDKLDEYLGVEAVRARGYFQIDQINRMREMHRRGRRDYSQHLWALLVLEEWHRQYID